MEPSIDSEDAWHDGSLLHRFAVGANPSHEHGAARGPHRADVLVVTDRSHPVQSVAGARLVELDLPARIEAELAADLPADPARAAAIVQQRLRDGGPELQRRIARAYQDVTDAWGLGIAALPAVVVDRRYVVYGDADVARAVARIDTFRRSTP
jgi:integrating conjugative element protein (TIGR03757 family)